MCEELGLPVNHHTGSASPDYGDYPEAKVMFLRRGHVVGAPGAVAARCIAGVMERHPTLQFVFTEQGTAWLPEQLATLDAYADRMSGAAGSQEHVCGADVMRRCR